MVCETYKRKRSPARIALSRRCRARVGRQRPPAQRHSVFVAKAPRHIRGLDVDRDVAIDGGIHIAALGGVWLTAVFGFAGLSLRNDGVAIDPQLPEGWSSLSFGFQWRGRRLTIRIDQAKQYLEATLDREIFQKFTRYDVSTRTK